MMDCGLCVKTLQCGTFQDWASFIKKRQIQLALRL